MRNERTLIRNVLLAFVLSVGLLFAPAASASEVPSSEAEIQFIEWYTANAANAAYYEWVVFMQDPANAAWFKWATTPKPVVVVSSHSVDGAIQAAFGDLGAGVVAQAHRVARCESEMNPRALNGNPSYQAAGLFQIIKQWASSYGQVTGVPYYDGRFDPYANARFARYLYNDGGGSWQHWVCKP